MTNSKNIAFLAILILLIRHHQSISYRYHEPFEQIHEIDETNVLDILQSLEAFLKDNTNVTHTDTVENIAFILTSVSSLPKLSALAIYTFFSVIDQMLNIPKPLLRSSSHQILLAIDKTTKTSDLTGFNTGGIFKHQYENIGVNLKDVIFNKSPNRLDVFIDAYTHDDDTIASLIIKTNFKAKEKQFRKAYSNSSSSSGYRISIVYFKNKSLFDDTSSKIAGSILSANVDTFEGSVVEKTSNLVNFNVKYDAMNQTFSCVYWAFSGGNGSGFWSDHGCQYLGYDFIYGNHQCQCNHTTHYALLFSPANQEVKTKVEYIILTSITSVGISLSLFGLILTLLTYIVFRQLREGVAHKCLMMLTSCLFIANVCFVMSTSNFNHLALCLTAAILMHYFLLASFMWMLMIAFAQYLVFVKLFDNHIERFVLKASILSFGVSSIAPITLVIMDAGRFYTSYTNSICWLNSEALIAAFVVPVLFITFVNLLVYLKIAYHIFRQPALKIITNKRLRRRNQISAAICTFVLMGSTWLYGLTLFFQYKYINEIIFCLLNTTQGFVIFLFHILLCKAKMDLWHKFFKSRTNKTQISKVRESSTTSSLSNSNSTISSTEDVK